MHKGNVIVLDCLHERLGHTVTLRRTNRRRQRLQAQLAGKAARTVVDVGRAVVRQPFDGCAWLRRAEALLDRCEHHIAHDVPAMAASSRSPTNSFPVMAVQRKRHAQRRAIVTAELEAVRAPADVTLVNGNASIMSAGIASLAKAPEQH